MTYRVAVIGLGYVGWPLLSACSKAQIPVMGIDLNEARIASLRDDLASEDQIRLTSNPNDAAWANTFVVCVPTPVDAEYRPDYSAVVAAMTSIGSVLHSGDLVILESTVAPGTTGGVVLRILESQSGLKAGVDFNLAFSPERIDPQNLQFVLQNTPKIVGGYSEGCLERAYAFYSQFVDSVHRASGLMQAEAAKILENTYRLVNVSLINQVADVCRGIGIDVREVIALANTKPFGFHAFYPSVGAGGHCIPVDPHYLATMANDRLGYRMSLVEEASNFNRARTASIVDRIYSKLTFESESERRENVLFLGLTYKPNVGDFRESRQIEVLRDFCSRGVNAFYHDYFLEENLGLGKRVHTEDLGRAVADADLVVLLQSHSRYLEEILSDSVLKKTLNATGSALACESLL